MAGSIRLNVLLLAEDAHEGSVLEELCVSDGRIGAFQQASSLDTARNLLEEGKVNAVYIDIFSLPINEALNFISEVRIKHPHVPFCLYSSAEQLRRMAGVPGHWRARLGHYFKLRIGASDTEIRRSFDQVVADLQWYLRANGVREKIDAAKQELSEAVRQPHSIPDIESVVRRTLDAVDEKVQDLTSSRQPVNSVPPLPMPPEEASKLVSDTLSQAASALRRATRMNIGIVVVGVFLLVASFVAQLILGEPSVSMITFGSLGTAGMVAAMITSPMRTIGAESRRLVHLQVGYFSFLTQLRVLLEGAPDADVLEISERLGRESRALLELFGEPK